MRDPPLAPSHAAVLFLPSGVALTAARSGFGFGLLRLLVRLLLGLRGGLLLRGGLGLLRRRLGDVSVLLLEPIDAALGVDQLLLPGEERLAVGADVQVQVASRRAGLPGRPAGAMDLRSGI